MLKGVDTAITVSNTTRLLPTFFFFIVVGPPDTQNEVANRGRAPAHSTDFPSKSKGGDFSTSILFKLRQRPTLIALVATHAADFAAMNHLLALPVQVLQGWK